MRDHTSDLLTHAIHAAQSGDRAAGEVLLRHVTRSGDLSLLLLGVAAAAHPKLRRHAITQTCAWWGIPFEERCEASFRNQSGRWGQSRRRPPNPALWQTPSYKTDWAKYLDTMLQRIWPAAISPGHTPEHWLRWNVSTLTAPPSALEEAVALAAPALLRWPAAETSLPSPWRARAAQTRPWPPLRFVRVLSLNALSPDAALLSHPDLTGLESLRLTYTYQSTAFDALALASLSRLKTLRIETWGASNHPKPDLSALATNTQHAWLDNIESLHMRCGSGVLPLGDLFLLSLCERDPKSLTSLTLSNWNISARSLSALALSPLGERLHTLRLPDNPLEDAGAIALAAANTTRPKSLNLRNCRITSKGALALAASPILPGLRSLTLGGNSLDAPSLTAILNALDPAHIEHIALQNTEITATHPSIPTATPNAPFWALARWSAPRLCHVFANWHDPALVLALLQTKGLPALRLVVGSQSTCAAQVLDALQHTTDAAFTHPRRLSVCGAPSAAVRSLLQKPALPEVLSCLVVGEDGSKRITCTWRELETLIRHIPRIIARRVNTGFMIQPVPPKTLLDAVAKGFVLGVERDVWTLGRKRRPRPPRPSPSGTQRQATLSVWDTTLTPVSDMVALVAQHATTEQPLERLNLRWNSWLGPGLDDLQTLLALLRVLPIGSLELRDLSIRKVDLKQAFVNAKREAKKAGWHPLPSDRQPEGALVFRAKQPPKKRAPKTSDKPSMD